MNLTYHAEERMSQRGIRESDLHLAMRHATRIYTGGALILFMRKKDIPDSVRPQLRDKLDGLTVIMEPDTSHIITAYKNKRGLRTIRRKIKRDLRPRDSARWDRKPQDEWRRA